MRRFVFLVIATGLAAAAWSCGSRPAVSQGGARRSATVLKRWRAFAEEKFERQNILREFDRFRQDPLVQGYSLGNLLLAPDEDQLRGVSGGTYEPGLPRGGIEDYRKLRGASLIGFQGRVTARLKTGSTTETILLEGDAPADEVRVEARVCRLAAFELSGSRPVKDVVHFYITCPELGSAKQAEHLLSELLLRAGASAGSMTLRTDSFFGQAGGPYVDVFQPPLQDFTDEHKSAHLYGCSQGVKGFNVGCKVMNYLCTIGCPPPPPAQAGPVAYP